MKNLRSSILWAFKTIKVIKPPHNISEINQAAPKNQNICQGDVFLDFFITFFSSIILAFIKSFSHKLLGTTLETRL